MSKIELLETLYNKLSSGEWVVYIDTDYEGMDWFYINGALPVVYMPREKDHWFYPYWDALYEYAYYDAKDEIGIDIFLVMFDFLYGIRADGARWDEKLIAKRNPITTWGFIHQVYETVKES